MKAGIITFHRAINYGAVLQTYALQTALRQMNIASEVIDYRCPKIEENYREYRCKDILRHAKPLLNFQYYRKNQKFTHFLRRNICFSNICYRNHEELRETEPQYDTFVTGSDQVWNPFCTDWDTAFLLDFVSTSSKKNSYAASFGLLKIPPRWQNQCRQFLNDFHGLSVREQQGREIIQQALGKTAAVHLDPVFLLSHDEWKSIAKIPGKKNYILVYLMQNSRLLLDFAAELSRKTGCGIVMIQSGLRRPIHAKYIRCAGPEDFVGCIANAEYVVTNSFHGTAFSIIFHKNLFVGLLDESSPVNSRLENILDFFKLKDRLICVGESACSYSAIAYEAIERIIRQEREKSFTYLKDILSQV